MRPRYKLVTFGDGSHGWSLAAKRLIGEARRSELFADFEVFRLRDLLNSHPFQPNEEFFYSTRGLGYWSWKPLLINKALQNLPSTLDGVVYLDSGCTINSTELAKSRMDVYFERSHAGGGLAFEMPGNLESHWTKVDLGAQLGVLDSPSWNSNQLLAGISFWKAGAASLDLSKDWVDTSFAQGLRFIDDSPSSHRESPEFVEHRHDQSIFSLLAKESRHFSVMENETQWNPDWVGTGSDFPIWATRHRSGLDFKRSETGRSLAWLRRIETARVMATDGLTALSRSYVRHTSMTDNHK